MFDRKAGSRQRGTIAPTSTKLKPLDYAGAYRADWKLWSRYPPSLAFDRLADETTCILLRPAVRSSRLEAYPLAIDQALGDGAGPAVDSRCALEYLKLLLEAEFD